MIVSPSKTAEPIKMSFGMRTWVDPRNHVFWGAHFHMWSDSFEGRRGGQGYARRLTYTQSNSAGGSTVVWMPICVYQVRCTLAPKPGEYDWTVYMCRRCGLCQITLTTCLWSPYVIGRPYIFSCCGLFFLLLLLSFCFPRLISAAADWMSAILPHMVWP